jgi:hypothetical protein
MLNRNTTLILACLLAGWVLEMARGELLAEAAAEMQTPAAIADGTPERTRRFIFETHWENDSYLFKPNNESDRYYTNGSEITLAWQPEWADAVAPSMPFAKLFGPARTAVGVAVGQLMFTPEDTSIRALQPNDRPYAGYLYAGLYWQRANEVTLDHFQIDLGVVGPNSLAKDAQITIHKIVDDSMPRGWGNQLDDEVTVQFHFRKKWRWSGDIPTGPQEVLQWQIVPQAGIALGTAYRHLDGGILGRVGFNLPDDFGPGRIGEPADATGEAGPEGWGAFIFGRAGGRIVEHNMFIEGNNFRDSHGVDEQTLVGEVQVGAGLRYRRGRFNAEATYYQIFQSKEFKLQTSGQELAGWTLVAGWAF